MLDIALIFFSLMGLVLCVLPSPIHWRARNTGTLLHIFWSCLGCLSVFLNSVVWANSVEDRAPVLCDISVKVQVAYSTGITAASLCITRRLAAIAGSRSKALSQKRKRIDLAIDLTLGLGLPLIVMAASYVVQPHRYDIFEAFGCEPSVWTSIPAIFLVYWWPALLSAASTVFGPIVHFLARRLQFNTVLRQSQSGLNTSQYIRLICLAGADVVFGLPLNIYFLVRAAETARPWIGWDAVHADWSQVLHFSSAAMARDDEGLILRMLSKYLCPILAMIFFLFFGSSEDAISEYTRWFRTISRLIRDRGARDARAAQQSDARWPTLGSTVNQLDSTPYPDGLPMSAKSPTSPYQVNGVSINVEVEKQVV